MCSRIHYLVCSNAHYLVFSNTHYLVCTCMYATPFVCFTVSECELHPENRNLRDTDDKGFCDAVKTMLLHFDRLRGRNTRSLKLPSQESQ